jgi:hypothetical protein
MKCLISGNFREAISVVAVRRAIGLTDNCLFSYRSSAAAPIAAEPRPGLASEAYTTVTERNVSFGVISVDFTVPRQCPVCPLTIGRTLGLVGIEVCHPLPLHQIASVQLSENANADVEKGRPSRSRGQDCPLASMPLRTRRVPSAGINTVHTP